MRSHSGSAVKDLHGGRRGTHLDRFLNERIGHAIEAVIHLNVIIDIHQRFGPNRQIVAFRRKRPQCRLIDLLE
jgi:hypothetical protein